MYTTYTSPYIRNAPRVFRIMVTTTHISLHVNKFILIFFFFTFCVFGVTYNLSTYIRKGVLLRILHAVKGKCTHFALTPDMCWTHVAGTRCKNVLSHDKSLSNILILYAGYTPFLFMYTSQHYKKKQHQPWLFINVGAWRNFDSRE